VAAIAGDERDAFAYFAVAAFAFPDATRAPRYMTSSIASLHGLRGASPVALADAVMELPGALGCRVIDVGGGELLTVGLLSEPVHAEVGAGEIG
jgi:hypothetical protein